MPNHLHVLTLDARMSIEKAMQLIKGGFSYRLKRELGYCGGIWQPGYSEVRVRDRASFLAYRDYIYMNPVKAGLVDAPEKYPYCSLENGKPHYLSSVSALSRAFALSVPHEKAMAIRGEIGFFQSVRGTLIKLTLTEDEKKSPKTKPQPGAAVLL